VNGKILKSISLFWTNMFPDFVDPLGQYHSFYVQPIGTREYKLTVEQGCHSYPEYCRVVGLPTPSATSAQAKKKSLYGKTKAAIGKLK
jgi:hypothetical protein